MKKFFDKIEELSNFKKEHSYTEYREHLNEYAESVIDSALDKVMDGVCDVVEALDNVSIDEVISDFVDSNVTARETAEKVADKITGLFNGKKCHCGHDCDCEHECDCENKNHNDRVKEYCDKIGNVVGAVIESVCEDINVKESVTERLKKTEENYANYIKNHTANKDNVEYREGQLKYSGETFEPDSDTAYEDNKMIKRVVDAVLTELTTNPVVGQEPDTVVVVVKDPVCRVCVLALQNSGLSSRLNHTISNCSGFGHVTHTINDNHVVFTLNV